VIAFDQPGEMFRLVERLAAVGVAVSCLEILRFPRPLKADGLMSWEVSRLRIGFFVRPGVEGLLSRAFSYPSTLALVGARLAAAATLAAGVAGGWATALVWVVAVTGIGFSLRCPFGLDGADQLYTLIFCGLAVARSAGGETPQRLFLWWLAAHVAVAYLTSGLAKLYSHTWRSGAAIPGVFGTAMYGNPAVGAWLKRRPRLSRAMAFAVIAGEIALPLCLVAPPSAALILLGCGVVFHLSTAVLMGLNSFLWAFVATYPALLYAGSSVREWLA
jgi:hypothetical protein